MAINTYKKDEEAVKTSRKNLFIRVLGYYSKYSWKIVFILFLVVLGVGLSTVLPLFERHALDVNVANKDIHGLMVTISIALALIAVRCVVMILRTRLLSKITNKIVYDIRKEAFAHLQTLSLYYFDSRPTGKILSRLITDVTSLKDLLHKLVSQLVPDFIYLVFVLVTMFVVNARLAMAVLVVIPLIIASVYFITIRGFKNWQSYRDKNSNMNAFTHESYTGINVIQAYGAEEETIEEADNVLEDTRKAWVKAVRRSDLMDIVVDWSQGLGFASLFFIAVFRLKTQSANIGELLAFTSYVAMFWQPIKSIAQMYNQITNQLTGAGRVFELIDTQSILQEVDNAKELVVTRGDVDFENISFAYPDQPDVTVLENVSFSVKSGQTIALVGPTGAGKTTIVNLLVRFYDPVHGTVKIDNQDVSKCTLSSLRRSVGVMTQEPFLFSGTIRENLMYGNEDVPNAKMTDACIRLGLEDFINMQPNGYDTEVSQSTMSQGQKQLIALARTLIADPKILILDEATSSIDTRTEQLVQKGMAVLMEGRTSFVVAHRLSTIAKADRIMVISTKGIAEEGNHRTLLEKGGIYAKLYKSQFEEV